MSFHLPHRGLSQELRDMIYKHALCPPDGLRIQRGYIRSFKGSKESILKCVQPVASALLHTNRQVHDATLPLLYGGNVFSLDMTCPEALQLLQALPKKYQMLIRKLSLPTLLMVADDLGNRYHAEELSQFVIDNLRLEDVTLYVPDDLNAGTKKNEGQYEWFMWTPQSIH